MNKEILNYNEDTNKTWRRGRKPATEEQKQQAKERQKQRVRITNTVARDSTLDKNCCLCGKKDSPILHNNDNPNMITFLCDECRKDKNKLEKAEQFRFDLEEYKMQKIKNRDNNLYLKTRNFTKQEVKELVEGFTKITNILTFGEYCEKHNISRFQFNKITKLYGEYFPDRKTMVRIVKEKSKAIQRYRLSEQAYDRALNKGNNTFDIIKLDEINIDIVVTIGKIKDKQGKTKRIKIPINNKKQIIKKIKQLGPNDTDRFYIKSCILDSSKTRLDVSDYFNKRLSFEKLLKQLERLEKNLYKLNKVSKEFLISLLKELDKGTILGLIYDYDDYVFEQLMQIYVTKDINFIWYIRDTFDFSLKYQILEDYIGKQELLNMLKVKSKENLIEIVLDKTNYSIKEIYKMSKKGSE